MSPIFTGDVFCLLCSLGVRVPGLPKEEEGCRAEEGKSWTASAPVRSSSDSRTTIVLTGRNRRGCCLPFPPVLHQDFPDSSWPCSHPGTNPNPVTQRGRL